MNLYERFYRIGQEFAEAIVRFCERATKAIREFFEKIGLLKPIVYATIGKKRFAFIRRSGRRCKVVQLT